MSSRRKEVNYFWGNDEYSHGAYALYGRGQWFRVMPILKRSHIHTHFAGEHLADWQGFMEGAINTGEEAAGKRFYKKIYEITNKSTLIFFLTIFF